MSNIFVFRQPPPGFINEYFGGGKGGSTTTTNNVTQIPPEVLARYNAVNARAETVAQAPYQSYSQDPNAFVAPLSQTQQAGIQNTNAMAGAAQPYYGAATGLAAQSTGSVNPSALNVGQYMNPYTQSVVNATQAAMNQQQGQQLSQQQAEAIKGGAFGGERAGLQRAQLMGQQGLAQAQAIAPLYQQNYNQALAAAQQQQGVGLGAEQANRQNLQNAATLFGSIGTNAQQAGLAGAQAQLAAGQTQQQTQQAGLQALYNQFQQQQGFPYQQAQFLANIAEGTGALSGNATSGTSTTTGGGGFFSDERLKENIQRVGETDDGQPIYRYNYKGDKNTQIGLLAQDVEKHHPEAVGLAGGYKTVNYKKATEDAVHKDGGGEVSDAYSIGAPSAMLQENSGKGLGAVPSLPQAFQGGRDIPIEAGANAAGLAAMRSPLVTGFAPGVREGKQAELASLQSSIANPGPNSNLLGSGPEYLQSRVNTLQDWLNQNNSQGGLVSGPGNFARGGLADGDYMNPALAYYSPQQAQQGVFQLQPAGQHQILRGDMMQAPPQKQQPDAMASAKNAADFALSGSKLYDKAKSYWDKETTAEPTMGSLDDAPLPVPRPEEFRAHGGLAGGRHHYSLGGGNPYGLGGGNDLLGDTIKEQDVSRRVPGDKASPPPPHQQQQSGGLGSLAQMASLGKTGKDAYGWAAKQLAGDASPTAMSATSTEAVPGLAGAAEAPAAAAAEVAPGIAGAAPEALTAGLAGGADVAGLAGAGETAAGLAGVTEAAAPVMTAAAEIPWYLMFLKDGGAVPRKPYQAAGSVPVVDAAVPEDAVPVEDTMPSARGDRENLTVVPRTVKPAPSEAPETPRAPKAGVASSYLPDFSKIVPEGAKDTLSSENFWVPAIAGLGAMLASPNKTLAGAIGSGLVGGTAAYTGLEKQQADIMKQRYDLAKGLFRGPTLVGDKWMWEDTQTGEMIPQDEYQRRQSSFITGKSAARPVASVPKPTAGEDTGALGTAKDIIATPQDRPAPRVAPQTAGAPQAAAPAIAAPAAPVTPVVPAVVPAVPAPQVPAPTVVPPASPAQALFDSTDPLKAPPSALQIQQAALANDDLWRGSDPSQNPRVLLPRVAKADQEIAGLQAQADALTAQATRATNERGPEAAKPLIDRATGLQAQADRVRKQRDDDRTAAQAALDKATQFDIKRGELITQKQAELQMAPAAARQALISEIAKIQGTAAPLAEAKGHETRVVEQARQEEGLRYKPVPDAAGNLWRPAIPGEAPTPIPPVATQPNTISTPERRVGASLDPVTGRVNNVIPAPPPGGGYAVPTPPRPGMVLDKAVTSENLVKSDADFQKDFPEKLQAAITADASQQTMAQAFKLFASDVTTDHRRGAAMIARAAGMPEDFVKLVAAGEPAAIALAEKEGVNSVLKNLKEATARFGQQEFLKIEEKGIAKVTNDPLTNFALIAGQSGFSNWNKQFYLDWDQARQNGWQSPSAFYNAWVQSNPLTTYIASQYKTLGNFRGMPLPAEMVQGAIYVAPDKPAPKMAQSLKAFGVNPGQLFRYGGTEKGLIPIDTTQNFSTYLEGGQ